MIINKKRLTALAAAALLLLPLLTGCGGSGSGSKASPSKAGASSSAASTGSKSAGQARDTLNLPYLKGKLLNPITTDSMTNVDLAPLLYECLARPDENFNPVNRLASGIQNSGTTVTVTLQQGLRFSDNSPLSANDVLYTYNLVKSTPSSYYYSRTTNITQITTNGKNSNTVVFTLASPDPLFANLLDIPIIKNNTGNQPTPIGSGMYTVSGNGSTLTLQYNPHWYKQQTPLIKTVHLVNIPDKDLLLSSLDLGNIDYLRSDYGNGTFSGSNSTLKPVNLNDLLFIGINASAAPLSSAPMRKAISSAIDRNTLTLESYSGRAKPIVQPFNPAMKSLPKTDPALYAPDIAKAAAALKEAGYDGKTPLTLLVNSENSARVSAANTIAANLQKVGISVKVEQLPFADYTARIQSSNFTMYLGEIKLSADMDLSPFFTAGGAASYGLLQNSQSYTQFTAWRSGSAGLSAVTDTFAGEMPFIPLCYLSGSVSYRVGLENVSAVGDDIFLDFPKWHFGS